MKTRLAVAAVAAISALALAGQAQAAGGLVGHWRFDEGAGTSAADSAGSGGAGELSAGAQWIGGKRGAGALRFDGAGGSVAVPGGGALEPSSGVTVQAWVRRTGSPGDFRHVVAKGATSCMAASYALYSGPDGGLMFYVSSGQGTDFTRSPDGGTGVWDGAWHLATGTYDGTTVRLYVDGAEVGTGTPRSGAIGYSMLTTDDLFVGRYAGCAGHDYAGDVDDVKVFDHALTAAEVQAQYAYDFQGFFSPVNNEPTMNRARAGSAIPVKFGLGGYQGMGIMAAGSPSSQRVSCTAATTLDAVEETVTAGSSSLSYDATTDRYGYVWKTDKAWAGTCRRLAVALDDGSVHTATFDFTR